MSEKLNITYEDILRAGGGSDPDSLIEELEASNAELKALLLRARPSVNNDIDGEDKFQLLADIDEALSR